MNKSILVTTFFVLLLAAGYVPSVSGHLPTTNKDVLVIDTIGEPESLDPAWTYDTAGGDVIQNIYETLITFKRVYTDGPYLEGKTDQFEPLLATSIPNMVVINETSPENLTWTGRMTFQIRGAGIQHILYAGIAEGPNAVATDKDIEREGPATKYDGLYFVPVEGANTGVAKLITDTDGAMATINHAAYGVADAAATDYIITDAPLAGITDYVKYGGIAEGPNVLVNDTDGEREGPATKYDGLYFVPVEGANKLLSRLIGDSDGANETINHAAYGVADAAATDYIIIVGSKVPRFHDGIVMTTEDVEYSFERLLVQDRDGGPAWQLYYPLLSIYSANLSDPEMGAKIDHAVESDANTVWFNFASPTPEITWNQNMSQTWSSIVEKSWAIANGDWNGTWTSWQNWHNPAISYIEGDGMMGTGPYKFSYWDPGISHSVIRNPNYWDSWPARIQTGSSQRLPSYISTILWNFVPDWTIRRARFLTGISDFTIVPGAFINEVLGLPDVVCYYPLGLNAGRHWSRGWVRGWYYNPLYQGFPYYHLFKQVTHLGDANMDGAVNVVDRAWESSVWGAPPGTTDNVKGDINGGTGGTVGLSSGPAPGIRDGSVDITDLALISAYWDVAPQGPGHP